MDVHGAPPGAVQRAERASIDLKGALARVRAAVRECERASSMASVPRSPVDWQVAPGAALGALRDFLDGSAEGAARGEADAQAAWTSLVVHVASLAAPPSGDARAWPRRTLALTASADAARAVAMSVVLYALVHWPERVAELVAGDDRAARPYASIVTDAVASSVRVRVRMCAFAARTRADVRGRSWCAGRRFAV